MERRMKNIVLIIVGIVGTITSLKASQPLTYPTKTYYPLQKPASHSPITQWFKSMENKFEHWKQEYWNSTPAQPTTHTITPSNPSVPKQMSPNQAALTCAAILCTTAATCFKVGCQKSYNKAIGQGAHQYLKEQSASLLNKAGR